MKKGVKGNIAIHIFFILFSLLFIVPFILVISISFSNEELIQKFGYRLIPMRFDLTAYRYVFSNPAQILNSYKTTIFVSVIGTLLSVIVMSLIA